MEFNYYTDKALKTLNMDSNFLLNAVLGICGEAGEFADLIKKYLFQGHPQNIKKIKEELGDILWYVNLACFSCGTSLEEVATLNLEKLFHRYGHSFSTEKSLYRNDEN